MAKTNDERKRALNLSELERAAELLASEGQKISVTKLADAIGIQRTQLYREPYKEKVDALIAQYAPPKKGELAWSIDEWEQKYLTLEKAYQDKSKECALLKEDIAILKAELQKKEDDLRRLRFNIYRSNKHNRI